MAGVRPAASGRAEAASGRAEASERSGGGEPAGGRRGEGAGGDLRGAGSEVGAGTGAPGGPKPAFWARFSVLGALHVENRQKRRPEGKTAPGRRKVDARAAPITTMSALPTAPSDPAEGRRPVKSVATTLDGLLTALRRRALGDSAVHWALLALAGWAAAVSLLLVWSKLTPTGHVTLIAAALAVLAALVTGAAWARRRPTVLQVARVADARLDLDERLASALFYADASGDMEARLRADAIRAATRYKPAQAFPLRRHRDLIAVALAVALVAVLLAVTPNPQSETLARQAANREATAQARRVVASARNRLGHPSSAEAQKIASALEAALSQLARAGTPLASLVALSDLSRQLAQLDNSSADANQAAEAAAGDALAGAPGTQKLSSELANGNLNAAAAGLRALAARLSSLSPAQRKALAAALGRAAASAGYKAGTGGSASAQSGSNGRFAGGLAQASSALSTGQLSSAGQALKSAAGGATASASAVSLQQQLAADQAAVQNEEARVASQAQAGTGTGGPLAPGRGGAAHHRAQGLAQGNTGAANGVPAGGPGSRSPGGASSNSKPNGAGAGGSGSGSQASGGGSGSGAGGAGSGSGSGLGPGGRGQGGEGGPGKTKGPQSGGTAKSVPTAAPSDQVSIAGQPGASAEVVGAQAGSGGAVKTTPYQAVLPTFAKTALQGLGSHVVSPADQGAVRSYFSSLGSGG